MKVMLNVALEGDGERFARAAVAALAEAVDAGHASRAALDLRLSDDEMQALSAFGMQQEERAVLSLWDTTVGAALDLSLPAGSRLVGAYQVDEVVQKDYERTWASRSQSPGFKMIAFLQRRDDLTPEAFSEHWRERHGPLAVARQPGFWRYVQNHHLVALTDASPAWDGIGEIHFRDVDDAVHRSYDSAEAQQLIWEDVARFLDYERCPTLTTHEWLILG